MMLALGLVGCVVGGGEGFGTFDGATAVDVELTSGEITIRTAHDDTLFVAYEGGGIGGPARPDVFQDDDGTVFVDARGGLGGGELEIDVPAGLPITAILERGELSIELDAPSDIDACVAAGEVSIGLPAGAYAIDVAAGAGSISVDLVDDDDAEHFVRACTGAGEIDLHVTDRDAHDD
jgi:hypothetical protein